VDTWEEEKQRRQELEETVKGLAPQMAIITPDTLNKTASTSVKDLDVLGPDLMPVVRADKWPTVKQLHQAQQMHGVKSDHIDKTTAYPLYVNTKGKVLLPKEHPVTMEVIAICHQGDLVHRSAMDTLKEFRNHYAMQGMGRKMEEEFIKALCRKCISCIKTRTGNTIPRPMWYMVYATRPFEYIHMDFITLPDSADGYKHVLIITCDFSLTTVLQPTKSADADTVVRALLEHWLSVYPDPDLIHTDGGSHFDNKVVEKLTKARQLKHTICTPYAKWAHGVAENNNKQMLNILRPLCRKLGLEDNQWPRVLKLVQGAMNRQARPSRGGRSPIELTTGIKPRTAASILYKGGSEIDVLDKATSETLDQAAEKLAKHMEGIYDAANLARRAKSKRNRKNTSEEAIPKIDVGDYVLYAKHKKDTKLDYTWLGPAVVTKIVTPLVYSIRPYTLYESQAFDVHVKRLRRFAGKHLHMTEQLRLEAERDHPDNIVAKIVGHEEANGALYMTCRWKGFTAEMDSAQEAKELFESCPDKITEYYKEARKKGDSTLDKFMEEHFPSLDYEEKVKRQRDTGEVATGKKARQRVQGRTLKQATKEQEKERMRKKARLASEAATRERNKETAMEEAAASAAHAEAAREEERARRNERAAQREARKGIQAAQPVVVRAAADKDKKETGLEGGTEMEAVSATAAAEGMQEARREEVSSENNEWTSTPEQRKQPAYALNTVVKESSIPGAGLGLYMREKATQGDRIAIYAGDVLSAKEAGRSNSQYIVQVTKDKFLDANEVTQRKGRYINHSGPGTTSNAKISASRRLFTDPKTGKPYVSVFATKTIKPGEEILMHYGKGWKWPWQTKAAPQMMNKRANSSQRDGYEYRERRHRNNGGRGMRAGRGRGIRGRGRGRGGRGYRHRRQSRCDINANTIHNLVAQAATLGNRARSALARLWNSGILYARGNKTAKLKEKVEAIYELFNLRGPTEQQVVAEKNTTGEGIESVVASGIADNAREGRRSATRRQPFQQNSERELAAAKTSTHQDNRKTLMEKEANGHRVDTIEQRKPDCEENEGKLDPNGKKARPDEMKKREKSDERETGRTSEIEHGNLSESVVTMRRPVATNATGRMEKSQEKCADEDRAKSGQNGDLGAHRRQNGRKSVTDTQGVNNETFRSADRSSHYFEKFREQIGLRSRKQKAEMENIVAKRRRSGSRFQEERKRYDIVEQSVVKWMKQNLCTKKGAKVRRKANLVCRVKYIIGRMIDRAMDNWQKEQEEEDERLGQKEVKRTRYGETQRNYLSLKGCPQCGHDYCKREVLVCWPKMAEREGRPPIACGLDITKHGETFCCVCGNRDRTAKVAGAMVVWTQRAGGERPQSPTGNMQIQMVGQFEEQTGAAAPMPLSPPPSPTPSMEQMEEEPPTPPPPETSEESAPPTPQGIGETAGLMTENSGGDAMAANVSPTDLMNNMTVNSEGSNESNDEWMGSSSEEENEQPMSPYQPFTTAMAGIPAPPLTPPQVPPLMLTNGNLDVTTDSDEAEEFGEGEYVVSDDTDDGDDMEDEEDDTEDGDDLEDEEDDKTDDDDIPPEITE